MRATFLLCWLCSLWLAAGSATDFNVPPRTRFKYTCACDAGVGSTFPCYLQTGQLCAQAGAGGKCSSYSTQCTEDMPDATLAAPQLSGGRKYYRISYVPNPYIPTSRYGQVSNLDNLAGTATFTYDDDKSVETGVTFDQISFYPCASYLDVGNTFISVGGCIALLFLSVALTGFIIGR